MKGVVETQGVRGGWSRSRAWGEKCGYSCFASVTIQSMFAPEIPREMSSVVLDLSSGDEKLITASNCTSRYDKKHP